MKIRHAGKQVLVLYFRHTGTKFLCGLRQNGSRLQLLYSDTTEERAVVGLANHGSVLQFSSEDEDTNQQHADHPDGVALAVDRDHHSTGIRMTPKVPPTFDGQSIWFEFEDLIDDWMGITTLTPERLGPSLKNALVGAAEFYKEHVEQYRFETPRKWRETSPGYTQTVLCEGSQSCVCMAVFAIVPMLQRKPGICTVDRTI